MSDNFKCIQCGRCCINAFPIIDGFEIEDWERIFAKLGDTILIESESGRDIYISFQDVVDAKTLSNTKIRRFLYYAKCPFLKVDNKSFYCEIYEIRPVLCRAYKCNGQSSEDFLKKVGELKIQMYRT